jgi:hypothetical protein
MNRSLLTVAFGLFTTLVGCSAADRAPSASDSQAVRGAVADSGTYVSVRPDLRRCLAPVCGGFFVTELNVAGARASYVSDLDFSQSQLDRATVLAVKTQELILKGSFGPSEPRFQTRAFMVAAAFEGTGVASDETSGSYVTLRADLRRCISPLCGGFFTHDVNTSSDEQYVSGLDWSPSNLTADQIDAFENAGVENLLVRGVAGPEESSFHTHPLQVLEVYSPITAAKAASN